MNKFLIIASALISFNAFAGIDCDSGSFKMTKKYSGGGFTYNWTFSNHVYEHFIGNRMIPYGDGKQTTENVGATAHGELPSRASLTLWGSAGPSIDVSFVFIKDAESTGYFLKGTRTVNDNFHTVTKAEYYLKQCELNSY